MCNEMWEKHAKVHIFRISLHMFSHAFKCVHNVLVQGYEHVITHV